MKDFYLSGGEAHGLNICTWQWVLGSGYTGEVTYDIQGLEIPLNLDIGRESIGHFELKANLAGSLFLGKHVKPGEKVDVTAIPALSRCPVEGIVYRINPLKYSPYTFFEETQKEWRLPIGTKMAEWCRTRLPIPILVAHPKMLYCASIEMTQVAAQWAAGILNEAPIYSVEPSIYNEQWETGKDHSELINHWMIPCLRAYTKVAHNSRVSWVDLLPRECSFIEVTQIFGLVWATNIDGL